MVGPSKEAPPDQRASADCGSSSGSARPRRSILWAFPRSGRARRNEGTPPKGEQVRPPLSASLASFHLSKDLDPPPGPLDARLKFGVGVFPGLDEPIVGGPCFLGLAHLLVESAEAFVSQGDLPDRLVLGPISSGARPAGRPSVQGATRSLCSPNRPRGADPHSAPESPRTPSGSAGRSGPSRGRAGPGP